MNSTVSGNHATRMGGLALADNNGNPAAIINSTVSGNHADTLIGGIFARPPLNLYNSTIAFNTSGQWSDGAGHYFAAGVYITAAGEMNSTIISENVNTDPAAPTPTADLTGAASTGFNGNNNNVMFCGAACPTDTTHDDPLLHPLQDNGGPTRTHVAGNGGRGTSSADPTCKICLGTSVARDFRALPRKTTSRSAPTSRTPTSSSSTDSIDPVSPSQAAGSRWI